MEGFFIVVGVFLVFCIIDASGDVSALESRVDELERKVKRG